MIFDALIIGAGPAGATVALLLANAGWSVAVVEKKAFPRRKVCGEFISATNFPLLQKLGIADFYLTHAGPEVRRVGLFAADTVLASAMPSAKLFAEPTATSGFVGDAERRTGVYTQYMTRLSTASTTKAAVEGVFCHWGRALGREHLDTALLNLAAQAGAQIWQPWSVKTLQRNADSFTATIISNDKIEQISARVVIMANGSWEKGLEPLSIAAHKPSDLLAFKAHFRDCDLPPDLMPLLAFPGGYGGLVHSDDGRVTLSCCIRRDALQAARLQYPGLRAGEAVFQHINTTCLGVRQVFVQAKREGNWLSAGPIRPGIRKCYSEGVFFVGNIAGEAHPVVAEGISMAMQSSWLLSEVLLSRQDEIFSGKKIAEAGQDYTEKWSQHFADRIHVAAIFAQCAMRPWCVKLILPLLKYFPKLLTFGAKLSGKIKQVVPEIISTKSTSSEKESTT